MTLAGRLLQEPFGAEPAACSGRSSASRNVTATGSGSPVLTILADELSSLVANIRSQIEKIVPKLWFNSLPSAE
jgi:hypothetical protein